MVFYPLQRIGAAEASPRLTKANQDNLILKMSGRFRKFFMNTEELQALKGRASEGASR